jgi:hypothetical protein
MLRTMAVLLTCSLSANAQSPASETLTLSLRTMSKALAGCREVYTRADRGTTEPLMRNVVGKDNYEKDLVTGGPRTVNCLFKSEPTFPQKMVPELSPTPIFTGFPPIVFWAAWSTIFFAQANASDA